MPLPRTLATTSKAENRKFVQDGIARLSQSLASDS